MINEMTINHHCTASRLFHLLQRRLFFLSNKFSWKWLMYGNLFKTVEMLVTNWEIFHWLTKTPFWLELCQCLREHSPCAGYLWIILHVEECLDYFTCSHRFYTVTHEHMISSQTHRNITIKITSVIIIILLFCQMRQLIADQNGSSRQLFSNTFKYRIKFFMRPKIRPRLNVVQQFIRCYWIVGYGLRDVSSNIWSLSHICVITLDNFV